jgi:hypothetical protein
MRRLILGFAVSVTAAAAWAQDDVAQVPSNYQGCMQTSVLEMLVSEGPDRWGFQGSAKEHLKASRLLEGYYLCYAVTDRGEEGCSELQSMPNFKPAAELGIMCRSDYNVLKTHEALRMRDAAKAVRHCSRWCTLNKSKEDKKMVCPNVCRMAIKELGKKRADACAKTLREVGRALGAGSDYINEATAMCRQKYTPTPRDCRGDEAADCKAMIALLRAYEKKDEKRCPKDVRYAGVCKALIRNIASFDPNSQGSGPQPHDACEETGLQFMKMVCDSRKATGDLQEVVGEPPSEDGGY